MNWKILMAIVIIGLSFVAFLGYVNRESDPDRLFANLVEQMQEGKFEDIYKNSSHFLQINANNKETFTERMNIALEKMTQADNKLDFQRDEAEEKFLSETINVGHQDDAGKFILTVRKLGVGENQVEVKARWSNYEGFFPKLVDLSVRKESEKEYISALLGTVPK